MTRHLLSAAASRSLAPPFLSVSTCDDDASSCLRVSASRAVTSLSLSLSSVCFLVASAAAVRSASACFFVSSSCLSASLSSADRERGERGERAG